MRFNSSCSAIRSFISPLLPFPLRKSSYSKPLSLTASTLLPASASFSADNCLQGKKKKKKQTLAKNSFNCPSLHLHCFHSTHCGRQTKLVLLLFQTYTILQWWIMQLFIPFPKPSIHHTFLSMFLFHFRAFFSPSAWDMCSKLIQNVKKKLSSIRFSKGWWGDLGNVVSFFFLSL